jgi:hypothetical protein
LSCIQISNKVSLNTSAFLYNFFFLSLSALKVEVAGSIESIAFLILKRIFHFSFAEREARPKLEATDRQQLLQGLHPSLRNQQQQPRVARIRKKKTCLCYQIDRMDIWTLFLLLRRHFIVE